MSKSSILFVGMDVHKETLDVGNWNEAHLRWLTEVIMPTPTQRIVFQEYVNVVTERTQRMNQLEQMLKTQVKDWYFSPVVNAIEAIQPLLLV